MGPSRRVASVVALSLAMVFTGAAFPGTAALGAGGTADPVLEQVLEDVRRTTRLIDGRTSVRQAYETVAFGRAWHFTALVTKDAEAIEVHTEGAPWFIPRQLQLQTVEVAQLLDEYQPRLVGTVRPPAHGEAWVVEAHPRPGQGGARLARFWVERSSGLVTHVELSYWWGSLVIDQTYQRVGPHMVLDRQVVRLEPLHVMVRVAYTDYQFEPPEDGA